MVFGHAGVAIPSKERMNISWNRSPKDKVVTISWNEKTGWRSYAKSIVKHIEKKTKKPIFGTISIENELPLGKGMGSSTALVIGLVKLLVSDEKKQKKIALDIEDMVNPGHSGMDFAAIWEGKPILYRKGKKTTTFDLSPKILQRLSLIDTGMPGEPTKKLVAWMKKRHETTAAIQKAVATIAECTTSILNGVTLEEVMKAHHRAQVKLGIVPKKTRELIAALERKGHSAKVIGAGARTGGGGMVLILRKETIIERMKNMFDGILRSAD